MISSLLYGPFTKTLWIHFIFKAVSKKPEMSSCNIPFPISPDIAYCSFGGFNFPDHYNILKKTIWLINNHDTSLLECFGWIPAFISWWELHGCHCNDLSHEYLYQVSGCCPVCEIKWHLAKQTATMAEKICSCFRDSVHFWFPVVTKLKWCHGGNESTRMKNEAA